MFIEELNGLRLVGGTALALQIGHRKSIDLDLFGEVEMDELETGRLFTNFNSAEIIHRAKHINIYEINNIKVDFINYSYPWIDKLNNIDGIRLAGIKDIAAMKLSAITGRGSKKDFIDIFYLLKLYAFRDLIGFYKQKYSDGSEYLLLKSLTYFNDADTDADIKMIEEIKWDEVKKKILREVNEFVRRES